MSRLLDDILQARGLDDAAKRAAFLQPCYELGHDPFLLPDMEKAVERLVVARQKQERITIYGDYDIDGLTATTVLLDSLDSFGFEYVTAFIPNRFVEGYGLTIEAIEKIAANGAQLIITVDCGSLSEKEIVRAGELGVDIIVTDHHNVAPVQPPAVAVINPKRLLQDFPEKYENYVLKSGISSDVSASAILRQDKLAANSPVSAELAPDESELKQSSNRGESTTKSSGQNQSRSKIEENSDLYPFLDLPGVGVAFKLVQALQTRLPGLEKGQEKWLLDLVALGTVCDVVTLQDENRMHVYWGLKVLAKTRRPGLKALMSVAGIEPSKLNARHLGFGLGPRMNASGRLETATYSLDMLRAHDGMEALEAARKLDEMNVARRAEQDKILKSALIEAEKYTADPVLVVSGEHWNHGIIGIVAAKLVEKFNKPTYVLEEMGEEAKGSARSYGDFSAADAIRSADDIITKGGGHKLAAGVTLPTANIPAFRMRVNKFYREQGFILANQQKKLLPHADVNAKLAEVDETLLDQIATLEPFGNGNPQPILRSDTVRVMNVRRMGNDGQHVKITGEQNGHKMDFLAFNAPEHFFVELGDVVTVWYAPELNEWRGNRSVEGRILHLEIA